MKIDIFDQSIIIIIGIVTMKSEKIVLPVEVSISVLRNAQEAGTFAMRTDTHTKKPGKGVVNKREVGCINK